MNRPSNLNFRFREPVHLSKLALITIASMLVLSASAFPINGQVENDWSDQLPRIPVVEPEETLQNFVVADGYQIQLVAAEPLIGSPVAIEWDASGRLFVCEMRGYSENRDENLSRISMLYDDDQDGVFDRKTVFADQLLWPTALLPYDGGLFVADAPNIYYLRDTDGDGVADSKQVVLTGFGLYNVQGLLNSFRWGLDNRIHVACSTVGGTIQRVVDGKKVGEGVEVRGRDLAFDPKTFEFEVTSGGGQHGMCFDNWGRKFVSSNSDHLQQIMYEDRYVARNPFLIAPPARISIAIDGPQAEVFRVSPIEPWRLIRTQLRVAGKVEGPVEGGGRAAGYFTGATGVTVYRGDAWAGEDDSLVFVGDVGSNLIHRKRLSSNGIQKSGRRIDDQSEFVASRDIWFRPAQFACGPDGTLSIVDVCREVIEHPDSLPAEIKRHLDLTAGRDRGRIYRAVPDGYEHRPTPNLKEFSTPELAELLNHPNGWHRDTAARLIYERNDDSVVPMLKQQSRESDSALGRMHSLWALQGLNALDAETLTHCLRDEHPQVVCQAIRLTETIPADSQLVAALARLAKHDSIDVRYQLAFSIGVLAIPERIEVLANILKQNPGDRWIQAAVGSSIADDGAEMLATLLQQTDTRSFTSFLQKVASQINRRQREEELQMALTAMSAGPNEPSLLPVFGQLLSGYEQANSPFQKIDPAIIDSVLEKIDTLSQAACEQVNDNPSVSEKIRAIGWLKYGSKQSAISTLVGLIRNSDDSELQIATVQALGSLDSNSLMESIGDAWVRWSPRPRAAALNLMLANPEHAMTVLNWIDRGDFSAQDLPLDRWQALAESNQTAISTRAKSYLASVTNSSRQSVIDDYQSSLTITGDRIKGAIVFKAHCAGCHRVDEVGHEIGPSLAAATTRGVESILENVLDPSREVNPQFVNYVVLTFDGITRSGMIAAENSNSITLRRAESVEETILRGDIEVLKATGLSIMPEGFEKSITPEDMADLIAFLMGGK